MMPPPPDMCAQQQQQAQQMMKHLRARSVDYQHNNGSPHIFYKGLLYGLVGFGCGLIGQGIASMIMNTKRLGKE
ncbi:hypothetical protein HanIR_Chr16g0832211 [Helianthus annuus]|nr:hypothetical protein HanIR_Chr16g0832211 [Helianthus annuus]